ncbi:hypothetical protein AB0H12_40085 [Actinosynnema sp. NPDC023794]
MLVQWSSRLAALPLVGTSAALSACGSDGSDGSVAGPAGRECVAIASASVVPVQPAAPLGTREVVHLT